MDKRGLPDTHYRTAPVTACGVKWEVTIAYEDPKDWRITEITSEDNLADALEHFATLYNNTVYSEIEEQVWETLGEIIASGFMERE